jgi:outer membrane protein assembly factor BamB
VSIEIGSRVMSGRLATVSLSVALVCAALGAGAGPARALSVVEVAAERATAWQPAGCRSVGAEDTIHPDRTGWRNIHGDASSSDEVLSVLGPDLMEGWTAEAATYNPTGPVFDDEGNVYFSPLSPYENVVLVSLDGTTGARRWAITGTTNGVPGGSAPMVLDDPDNPGEQIVYLVLYDRALAVRPDGSVVWDVATGLTVAPDTIDIIVMGTNYVPAADAIAAVATDGSFLLLDRATGASVLAAPYELPGEVSPDEPPLLTPEARDLAEDAWQVLVDAPDGAFAIFADVLLGQNVEVANMFSVDPGSSRIWVAATAPDAEDGTTDGVSEFGALYGLDVSAGPGPYTVTEVCHASFAGGSASTPTISADGTRLYVGDSAGKVLAISAADCSTIWEAEVGGQVVGSIGLGADNGAMYAATLSTIVEVLDQGDEAEIGWTAELGNLFTGLAANESIFNLNLVAVGANGLFFQAGAGRLVGVLPVPTALGVGVLDRADGHVRSFVEGGEETVAVMSAAPDGSLYVGNSPLRRAVAVGLGLDDGPLVGGITYFPVVRHDRSARDGACAVADRAANAHANAGACPDSAAADADHIARLLAQLRDVAIPAAVDAGDLSTADDTALAVWLDAAETALDDWDGGDTTALADVSDAAAVACALLDSNCPVAPRDDCRQAASSSLQATVGAGEKNKLAWKWGKGAAIDAAEFGNPQLVADYALCVWGGSEPRSLVTGVPSNFSRWQPKADKGFAYKSKPAVSDGIEGIKLGAGVDGKTKAQLKAKGAAVPEVVLPLTTPLIVQLVNTENDLCLESVFDAASVTSNGDGKLKAKAR